VHLKQAAALLLLSAAPAGAGSLDYIEHIFGATNVNAAGGHGRLTIGVADDGELTVLSWPSPGFADQLQYLTSNAIDARTLPHLGALDGMGDRLGLLIDGKLVWLRDLPHTQGYSQDDSVVPVTTYTSADVTVTLTDVVSVDADVLTRHVQVVRSAAQNVSLVVYENLSPTLSEIPEIPIADWALDSRNDFLAAWDAPDQAIVHFHPGDRAVFRAWTDLVNLDTDYDYGPVEDLMKNGGDVQAFVAGLDTEYPAGVAALVTTEPPPAQHQVGGDATPLCTFIDSLVDNVKSIPQNDPGVPLLVDPGTADLLRCTDKLPVVSAAHGWTLAPKDALTDIEDDGALTGDDVAAAQTNGALIVPIVFTCRPPGRSRSPTGSRPRSRPPTRASPRRACRRRKATTSGGSRCARW
jgi:hypothetical protein